MKLTVANNSWVWWLKKLRFKIATLLVQIKKNRQRSSAPRNGITFGALKQLRKKRQKSGMKKGNDTVLTREQVNAIAKCFKDERLLSALAQVPTQILDWQSLKDFSEVVRFTGEHEAYELALNSFDPSLQLMLHQQVTACSFVGSGLGSGTLNAYRKLEQGGVVYFEKIYLNDSRDLEHLRWFEKHYRALLDDEYIRVPKVLEWHSGLYATAVYFEFLTEQLDNCLPMPQRAIVVALNLYKQPLNDYENSPEAVLAFEKLELYHSCFKQTQCWLVEMGLSDPQLLTNWELKIKALPRQLSHGDLHGKNMGEPNIVIDWDRAGLYPIGFDIAYAISNNYLFISVGDLHDYLHLHCRGAVGELQWSMFLFACSYFCLLFYMRKRHNKIFDEQLMALYKDCVIAAERIDGSVFERPGYSI